jgi:hypothetical protein
MAKQPLPLRKAAERTLQPTGILNWYSPNVKSNLSLPKKPEFVAYPRETILV